MVFLSFLVFGTLNELRLSSECFLK
jgi:hypothetical protein